MTKVDIAYTKEIKMSRVSTKAIPEHGMMSSKSARVSPEYEAAVTKLADEHKNQRFLNDSHHHAKLLADLMIGRATEYDDVLIYTRSLPTSCYGDALKNSKSKNIRIVLDDASGVSEIESLPKEVQSRINYCVLQAADGAHFFVAGDAFRLELDHHNAKAVANFNDPDAIEVLGGRFNNLWSSTVSYAAPDTALSA